MLVEGLGLTRFGERFVNITILLLVATAFAAWWFILYDDESNRFGAALIIFCVVAIAVLYTLSPQITWAHNMRNPPPLDRASSQLLGRYSPFFRQLSLTEKKRFASRVAMFLNDKEFVLQGTPAEDEDVPLQMKLAVAASVIQFTFGLDEFWLPDLEKVICYPRLFPSRERPAFHAGEAHDDGCLILSALMTQQGLTKPAEFYHIGLHVAAEYWLLRNELPLDDVWTKDATTETDFTTKICQIRQFRPNFWQPLTGNAQPDLRCLAIEAFFTKPEQLHDSLPTVFNFLSEKLNQDPRKDTYPLVKPVSTW